MSEPKKANRTSGGEGKILYKTADGYRESLTDPRITLPRITLPTHQWIAIIGAALIAALSFTPLIIMRTTYGIWFSRHMTAFMWVWPLAVFGCMGAVGLLLAAFWPRSERNNQAPKSGS